MKICTKCKIEKELSEFNKNKAAKDGLRYQCKECLKQYQRDNRERFAEYRKQYYQDNRERRVEYQKQYRRDNSERIAESKKQYRLDNRERTAEYKKQYRRDNRKRLTEYQRQYQRDNRERLAEYQKNRRANDINVRLRDQLRSRTTAALKGKNKSAATLELLGADVDFVRGYLESQFTDGMSWDNYGKWHIDHIRPCASFDLADPEQQRKCFHYSNLQPLWAEDNLRKGAKFLDFVK